MICGSGLDAMPFRCRLRKFSKAAPGLRAGVTFAEGMLDLVPTARIAHIGLYREPETFTAVEYFFKAPSDLHERLVIVISPVLATANSAVAAVDRLKERGANDIRLVCLIGAPEGVERMRGIHPDVPIWLAAIRLTSRMSLAPRSTD